MEHRAQFSRLQSACSPVSKLDAREKADRRRLHCRSISENGACSRRIESNRLVEVSPRPRRRSCLYRIARSVQRSVKSESRSEKGGHLTPRDVRALKGLRSTRHSKGEPPLQKRGLPLAASSLAGDRVPLGPREAIEHPGTLGTVRDVRAPGAHDGASDFEKVRSLIGPRNLGANHV